MSFKQEWSEEESLAIKYPFSSNRKNIRFLRANSYGHPEITIMNFCLSGCSYMEIPMFVSRWLDKEHCNGPKDEFVN